ncbi:MAG: hypothetical protein ACFFD2_10180 [Promethearchaeota archaeon]
MYPKIKETKLRDYTRKTAKKAVINLFKSINEKFYISGVAEALHMDLKLASESVFQLYNERIIK